MIFVTGGTGLVGAHLLLALTKQGNDVSALRRACSSLHIVNRLFKDHSGLYEKIRWVDGDITDVESLEKNIENRAMVYHCAGLVSLNPRRKKELYRVNIKGTENIVNVCLDKKIGKLVHVSSVAALGRNTTDKILVDEDTHWESSRHNSDYAISKYGAEREVWRGIAEGLPAVIVSPSVIIGAGNWNDGSCRMIKQMNNGLKFYTDGESGFIDVRDVVNIMIKLMKEPVYSERYLLSAENISYRKFFETAAVALSKQLPFIKVNRSLMTFIQRFASITSFVSGSKPFITKQTVYNAFQKYIYSNKKILSVFPDYSFIPVEKSIKETCDLFKSEQQHLSLLSS